jgi:hypothetical protein
MGNNECIILGPKSLAGLIAYPVVPPNDKPIAQTKKATGIAPNEPKPITDCVSLTEAFVKYKIVKTNTNVPTISLNKLENKFLIAGTVQKTAFLVAPSLVASK